MLVKLIRHEFAATWRAMVLLLGVMAGFGVIGFFVMRTLPSIADLGENNPGAGLVITAYMAWFLLYFLAIFAGTVGTSILVMLRYYRNFYTSEGYLTFTLPVPTASLLHAKMITGFIWLFLSNVFTGISVMILAGGFLLTEEMKEFYVYVQDFMKDVPVGTMVLVVITWLVGLLYGMLSIYFCISVGQLWQKHKIGGAIVCFFAVNFVRQILSSVINAVLMFFARPSSMDLLFAGDVNSVFWMNLILSLFCTVLFYITIRYINEHQVNLD